MTQKEINQFIEIMKEICDNRWTPERVEEEYGDLTLREALDKRLSKINTFYNFVEEVVVKDLEAMGRTEQAETIKKALNNKPGI